MSKLARVVFDPDVAAPSVPVNVAAAATSQSVIHLGWSASSDSGGSGLAGYRVYRSATVGGTYTQIAQPATNAYDDAGLSGTATWFYKVSAYDGAGNESVQSSIVSATTPDQTAPSVPANLVATAVSQTQINLTWTASTDTGGSGLAAYRVFRNGGATAVGSPATNSFSDTGLTAGTAYTYRVAAVDNAGNLSAQSSQAGATTQVANRPPAWTQTPTPSFVQGAASSLVLVPTYVSDPDGDLITFSLVSGTLPAGVTINNTTKALAYDGIGAAATANAIVLQASATGGTANSSAFAISIGAASTVFPLTVSTRQLLNKSGQPFLINGDSAWSLMAQPNDADVTQYLNDRASRGFNTVLASLIEHRFADQAPKNALGVAPFTTSEDIRTTNDAYFARAVSIVGQANALNLLVMMTPAYLGFQGGIEGWWSAVSARTTAECQAYGAYLGTKFAGCPNILWVMGGDYYDPSVTTREDAIVAGIKSTGRADWLFTAHAARDQSSADVANSESWLTVNATYTQQGTCEPHLVIDYGRATTRPFFVVEALYEGESGTAAQCRAQAYWSVLTGGVGHLFGNNPIWNFGNANGMALGNPSGTWQQNLSSAGSASNTVFGNFFAAQGFANLVPDRTNSVLTGGVGSQDTTAVAARASDGSKIIAYMPTFRAITIALSQLAQPVVTAIWTNPSTGANTAAGSFSNVGSQSFTPPAGGDGDWLLTLTATGIAADKFVASTGLDTNPGTQAQPFKTIAFGMSQIAAGQTLGVLTDLTENINFGTLSPGTSGAYKRVAGLTPVMTINGTVDGSAGGSRFIIAQNLHFNAGAIQVDMTGVAFTKWITCGLFSGPPSGNVTGHLAGDNQLYENCWFGGNTGGRYATIAFQRTNTLYRRCVVRTEPNIWGPASSNPTGGITIYSSNNCAAIQCIAVDCQNQGNGAEWLGGFNIVANVGNSSGIDLIQCIVSDLAGLIAIQTDASNVLTATLTNCVGVRSQFGLDTGTHNTGTITVNGGEYSNNSVNGIANFGPGPVVVTGVNTSGNTSGNFNGVTASGSTTNPLNMNTLLSGMVEIGTPGTLRGDPNWNTPTATPLFPFRNEDVIRAKYAALSTRGFCAAGQTLTTYLKR